MGQDCPKPGIQTELFPGQLDEIVTVQPFAADGSRRGIVMHVRPFNMIAVTQSAGVVDAEQDATVFTRPKYFHQHDDQHRGCAIGYDQD